MEPKPSKRLSVALDLGKKLTGWAVMVGGHLVTYGTWSFEHVGSDAELATELYDKLAELVGHFDVDQFVYENAMNQKGRAGEVFQVMATTLKVFCFESKIPLRMVGTSQVKSWAAGRGNAKKPEIVQAINFRYELELDDDPKGEDHNIADAIAVGLAAYQLGVRLQLKDAR